MRVLPIKVRKLSPNLVHNQSTIHVNLWSNKSLNNESKELLQELSKHGRVIT